MLLHYKKKATVTFAVWVALWALFFISLAFAAKLGIPRDTAFGFSAFVFLSATIALIVMLYYLCKGKGYPGWYAIVGLTFVLGLLLVLLLKDKYPDGQQQL